jgi:hypothetical protein
MELMKKKLRQNGGDASGSPGLQALKTKKLKNSAKNWKTLRLKEKS